MAFPQPSALVAQWPCDEAAGNALEDLASRDLTAQNAPGTRNEIGWAQRDIGSLSGDPHLDRAYDAALAQPGGSGNGFTVALWWYPDLVSSTRMLLGAIRAVADGYWGLIQSGASMLFRVSDGTTLKTVTMTGALTVSTKHLVVGRFDPDNDQIHVTCIEAGTVNKASAAIPATYVVQAGTDKLTVGRSHDNQWRADGGVGPIYVWDAVLTDDEIEADLWNGGTALLHDPSAIVISDLVADAVAEGASGTATTSSVTVTAIAAETVADADGAVAMGDAGVSDLVADVVAEGTPGTVATDAVLVSGLAAAAAADGTGAPTLSAVLLEDLAAVATADGAMGSVSFDVVITGIVAEAIAAAVDDGAGGPQLSGVLLAGIPAETISSGGVGSVVPGGVLLSGLVADLVATGVSGQVTVTAALTPAPRLFAVLAGRDWTDVLEQRSPAVIGAPRAEVLVPHQADVVGRDILEVVHDVPE